MQNKIENAFSIKGCAMDDESYSLIIYNFTTVDNKIIVCIITIKRLLQDYEAAFSSAQSKKTFTTILVRGLFKPKCKQISGLE